MHELPLFNFQKIDLKQVRVEGIPEGTQARAIMQKTRDNPSPETLKPIGTILSDEWFFIEPWSLLRRDR
jgi:hypothetical protein